MLEKIQNQNPISYEYALIMSPPGLFLEFGVGNGTSIKHLSSLTTNKIYGFDSFTGLPEDWTDGHNKGHFACDLPTDMPSNVELVVGLFNDSLPKFLKTHTDQVGFVHIDCDLYSSTKTVLDLLNDRLLNNTIIIFDEFYGYAGWEKHEYLAFNEFLKTYNWHYEYLGGIEPHPFFRKCFRIFR